MAKFETSWEIFSFLIVQNVFHSLPHIFHGDPLAVYRTIYKFSYFDIKFDMVEYLFYMLYTTFDIDTSALKVHCVCIYNIVQGALHENLYTNS